MYTITLGSLVPAVHWLVLKHHQAQLHLALPTIKNTCNEQVNILYIRTIFTWVNAAVFISLVQKIECSHYSRGATIKGLVLNQVSIVCMHAHKCI